MHFGLPSAMSRSSYLLQVVYIPTRMWVHVAASWRCQGHNEPAGRWKDANMNSEPVRVNQEQQLVG